MTLISLEKISLKNNPYINEDMIQKYISDNPSVLGLGELNTLRREKVQPSKGRLDILLQDDNNMRYEVEVQLGATDPSHIVRTIEYWDIERKRYPQYDHCAVIVAEDINGRFMNVISLFNGTIPFIAIQIAAFRSCDDYVLTFTKVLNSISQANEEDESYELTDRKYWENRSTPKMLKNVDELFKILELDSKGYELKYNKFYIGLSKDGLVKNFVSFKPKKNFLYLAIRGDENPDKLRILGNHGFEIQYIPRWKQYEIRIENLEKLIKDKEIIMELVKDSMSYYNISF